MSGKRDREARRDQRLHEEAEAASGERRQRLIKLGSAAAFLAIVAVAVLIVIASSGGGGGDASNITEVADVDGLLEGIPQKNLILGHAGAEVKLIEFGDLQCPICKGFSEEVLPPIIEKQVSAGEVTLEFRSYTIISQQSIPAGAAAIAAGEQGRGWNFIELFYRNQGEEASGYVTDEFLTAIAKAAGVPNIAKWNSERKSKRVVGEVEATTAEAESLGFTGTPSFAVEGPGTKGLKTIGTPQSTGALEEALEEAR